MTILELIIILEVEDSRKFIGFYVILKMMSWCEYQYIVKDRIGIEKYNLSKSNKKIEREPICIIQRTTWTYYN